MSALPVDSHRRPRLNPFAFPSDTNLRFILLFVFVIAADIRRWYSMALLHADSARLLEECLGGMPMIGRVLLDSAKTQDCLGPLLLQMIPAIAIGLLLLTAVTGAIYWWYPIWEISRLRLTPLDPEEAPELFATF